MVKNILARNTISGKVAEVPERYLTHPIFGDYLEAVEDGAKDYHPELYKPGTVAEKNAAKKVDDSKAPVIPEVKPDINPEG